MPDKVDYKPYQKSVAGKLQKQRGLLVYHGLGSGKTLTSIFAAEQTKQPTQVITPASLGNNFKKELVKADAKGKYNVTSFDKFIRHPEDLSGKNLIVDEAHHLRNTDTKRSKIIENAAHAANKVILLTGTPIQNKPSEIAPLINTVKGSKILPERESDFNAKYVKRTNYNPGPLSRLFLGRKPHVEWHMTNSRDFAGKVRGSVSYYSPEKRTAYPSSAQYAVYAPMTERQALIYKTLERKLPSQLRYKIQNLIPVEKQETGPLNSFLSATRQISNTPKNFDVQSPENSPKLDEIVRKMKKSKGPALVYSNYLQSGVYPLAAKLEKAKIPHGIYTGKLSAPEKKKLVQQYNKGKLKALIVSSSGGEGLDLKNTRQVHIMEPHWHNPKIDQVIGRAIRVDSHKSLPPRQRHVDVYKYYSTLPEKPEPRIYKWLGIKPKKKKTVDEYLSDLSSRKETLNKEFLNVLQREGRK